MQINMEKPVSQIQFIISSVGLARLTSLFILCSLKVGALVSLVKGLKSIIILGFEGSDLLTANKAIVFVGLMILESF